MFPKVKVIAAAKNKYTDKTIVTFECEYHRFFHSEMMTHRMVSKNAASSRAIPSTVIADHVLQQTAIPVSWGRNKPGMQAEEELSGAEKAEAMITWLEGVNAAVKCTKTLAEIGVHKQIANRPVEPFQIIKVVMTATDWNNFFHLRNHKDAQPEFQALCKAMKNALDVYISQGKMETLKEGEWFVPYYQDGVWRKQKNVLNQPIDESGHTLEEAKAISASCCAQTSYRKSDDTLDKALSVRERLVGDGNQPVHASPFEHQATPVKPLGLFKRMLLKVMYWWVPEGITHISKDGVLGSGNFNQWIQHRQLIPNNVKKG